MDSENVASAFGQRSFIELPWFKALAPRSVFPADPAAGLWYYYLTLAPFPADPSARAEVRCSFITTTVRDESQVTPQGSHR